VPHLFYTLRMGKILQIPPSHDRMNFGFLCCSISFRPFCCSKTYWKGPPTNGNLSQSWIGNLSETIRNWFECIPIITINR
jgi:hypothetical protein